MSGDLTSKRISVRGVVQGVGFRPFVYRLAHEHGLTGWVLNHSGGVEIEVEGPPAALAAFLHDLEAQAPPLARIEGLEVTEAPLAGYTAFEIRHSVAEAGRYQLISPDIATCPDCLRELFDPADRRYRYPFTNCTNCGPRFTIIADIPYDRPLTTMRDFVMCPQCQAEYDDPLDRRFHAQPNACPVCGPHLWLVPGPRFRVSGSNLEPENLKPFGLSAPADASAEALRAKPGTDDVIAHAVQLLQSGAILAIKGLGGFHLACDATNEAAVRTLRERKGRPAKPLAVMMATLDEVRQHCQVSEEEERLLTSPQCPIVLLPWKPESSVSRLVAPRNNYLGVMLPYTPLHHVLLREAGRPLVMTSGNLSEEPIARDNDEALRRLGHLADVFLMHNRDIYARYDDSVWFVPRIGDGEGSFRNPHSAIRIPQPIRRSRGYAPFPIKLPFKMRQILACGAELKNTFCLTREEYAFLSQHIGDLENLETLEHFESTIELYKRLFRIKPQIVAYDMHPDYLSTKYARSAIRNPQSAIAVQHHHAHIASCLADNGWTEEDGPVIGVAWDGTGYGTDGRIWGGEFLVADYRRFRRAGHLEYLPMPGGEAAIHNPYRLALGYLYALTGGFPSLPWLAEVSEEEGRIIRQQVDQEINCPLTSAGGRLFDAVAALLGVRRRITYEGQAAVELEMAASTSNLQPPTSNFQLPVYPFHIDEEEDRKIVRLRELFEALMAEWQQGVGAGEMAYRFHVTVAEMMETMCERIAGETGLRTVALSGGCFQNRLLLALTVPRLQEAGFHVLLHRQVPCNDGGISLGQAVIAHFAVGDHDEVR
ncbi:MAG: carbamoyltransferase HypF [Anaerolineae bacterium]|nr:carbamoyltransferase HypF [Anaerolineae bacterium]